MIASVDLLREQSLRVEQRSPRLVRSMDNFFLDSRIKDNRSSFLRPHPIGCRRVQSTKSMCLSKKHAYGDTSDTIFFAVKQRSSFVYFIHFHAALPRTKMTTTSTDSEDLAPSAFFTQIILQSGSRASSNRQQPILQADAEKLLVQCASLFAQELVAKSASVAQQRPDGRASIRIDDVNFVLKHQWPIYDASSIDGIAEN